jgi:hypothetical protein
MKKGAGAMTLRSLPQFSLCLPQINSPTLRTGVNFHNFEIVRAVVNLHRMVIHLRTAIRANHLG